MPYEYRAKMSSGSLSTGIIDAGSMADAQTQLRDQGLFPLALTEVKNRTAVRRKRRKSRVPKRDLMLMTTQLSIMHKSGLDLAESLKTSARQVSHPTLRESMQKVVGKIEDGQSFSSALETQSHIFGDAFVASVAAGEASGTLGNVLARLTNLLRNEVRLFGTIRSVATYPVVLMIISGVVINALMFFVLPQFGKVFASLDKTPPLTTQVLLSIGEAMRSYYWVALIALGGLVIGVRQFMKSLWFRHKIDNLLLKLPMLGKATRSLLSGRMFRLIGMMLQSGVPLLEAIQLCRRSIKNVCYQKLFDQFENEVTSGRGIALVLNQSEFIPDGAAEMISTAEKSGDLGGTMDLVGEFYEDEGERQVKDLANLLEPAIICVMGAVVAVVVMSVILPLLDISSASSS